MTVLYLVLIVLYLVLTVRGPRRRQWADAAYFNPGTALCASHSLGLTVLYLAVSVLYLSLTVLCMAWTALYLAMTVLYLSLSVLCVPRFPRRRQWADAAYFNPGLYRFEMQRGEGELVRSLSLSLSLSALHLSRSLSLALDATRRR